MHRNHEHDGAGIRRPGRPAAGRLTASRDDLRSRR
jgi:hypothetical protein